MKAPVVYFAHPIDLIGGDPDRAERVRRVRETRELLASSGFVVYDPATAFEMRSGLFPHAGLERINRAVLGHCDAMVACYPEARTIGVPMEIEAARAAGLPLLVLTDVGAASWALAGVDTVCQVDALDLQRLRRKVSAARAQSGLLQVVQDCVDGQIPTRAYTGDAGFDLAVSEDTAVPAGQFRDVPCGISVQLPAGTWGMIQGRSSTLRRHRLLVMPGVIDNGYRGPLYAGVHNLGDTAFTAKAGMRLAQLIPLPLTAATMAPVLVQQLDTSDRGTSGFGSSGE